MSQEYENILVPVDGSKQAELAFNKAVATAKRNGAHLKTVVSFDFPRDHHNDLIMMGASGLSRVQRAMVGSVTSFVKRNAQVDVLVVRTDVNNKLPEK